jgi:hypothetical protein
MMHLRPPQGSRTDVFIQGLVAIASSNEAQNFGAALFLNAAGDSEVPASRASNLQPPSSFSWSTARAPPG